MRNLLGWWCVAVVGVVIMGRGYSGLWLWRGVALVLGWRGLKYAGVLIGRCQLSVGSLTLGDSVCCWCVWPSVGVCRDLCVSGDTVR